MVGSVLSYRILDGLLKLTFAVKLVTTRFINIATALVTNTPRLILVGATTSSSAHCFDTAWANDFLTLIIRSYDADIPKAWNFPIFFLSVVHWHAVLRKEEKVSLFVIDDKDPRPYHNAYWRCCSCDIVHAILNLAWVTVSSLFNWSFIDFEPSSNVSMSVSRGCVTGSLKQLESNEPSKGFCSMYVLASMYLRNNNPTAAIILSASSSVTWSLTFLAKVSPTVFLWEMYTSFSAWKACHSGPIFLNKYSLNLVVCTSPSDFSDSMIWRRW